MGISLQRAEMINARNPEKVLSTELGTAEAPDPWGAGVAR